MKQTIHKSQRHQSKYKVVLSKHFNCLIIKSENNSLGLQNIVQTPDKHGERSSMMMMVVTLITVVFLQELIAGEEEDEG